MQQLVCIRVKDGSGKPTAEGGTAMGRGLGTDSLTGAGEACAVVASGTPKLGPT
jgi:hypothetical protein